MKYPESPDSVVAILKAIANPKRVEILEVLREGEHTVSTLADKVQISMSSLSQHLKKLREAKIVTSRRASQEIYYSILSTPTLRLLDFICGDGLQNEARGVSGWKGGGDV